MQRGSILNVISSGESSQISASPLVPSIQSVDSSGSIPAGAKYISIKVLSGSGTVLGIGVNSSFTIDFPYVEVGWQEIVYTVNRGSTFLIQVGR